MPNAPPAEPDPDARRATPSVPARTTGAWGIDDAEHRFLQAFVRASAVRTVLEFGPGRSTEAFLETGCRVWSLEHDPKWLAAAEATLGGRAGLTLRLFRNGAELAVPELDGLRFDLAFVDGPPSALYADFARLNAMRFAAARADVLMLHDARRPHERNTLEVMKDGGWDVRLVETGRGLAVLTRTGQSSAERGAIEAAVAVAVAALGTCDKPG